MRHLSASIATLGMSLGLGLGFSSGASAQNVQVGILNCEVSGGLGLVVTSRKDMVCTFQNAAREIEVYDGYIRKFGIDLGATTAQAIVWNVFAPSGANVRGALSGTYGGASAEATFVAGLGANVLLGGSRRSVALQPVSLSGQSGINVAVGVTDLTLQLRPPEPRRRTR